MADKNSDDAMVQAALLAEEQQKEAEAKEKSEVEAPEAGEPAASGKPEDAPEQTADTPEPPKPTEAKDAPDPEEKDEEKDPEDDPDEKKDDPEEPAEPSETDPDKPKTRGEKRAEKKEAFLDRIRRNDAAKKAAPTPPASAEKYDPLDYNNLEKFTEKKTEGENEETILRPDVLAEDRQKFADAAAAKAAEDARAQERWVADQERFWDTNVNEQKMLAKDPEFKFLESDDPEDKERAGRLTDIFLGLAGYTEVPVTNEQGQPLADRETGKPLVRRYVTNTDYSFEQFAREYVADQKRYAAEAADETQSNITKQKAHAGIRPGGESRKTKTFTPSEIAAMDPDELEANADRINAQAAEYAKELT